MRVGRLSSTTPGAYGRDLARRFGAEDAPAIVTRSLRRAAFAATEIRVDHPNGDLSEAIPPEDAYLFCLVLRDTPDFSYWEEGREYARYFHNAGETTISDLRRQPSARIDKPIHSLAMYLPRASVDALADQAGLPRAGDLRFEPGAGVRDDIVKSLGLSLLPGLCAPEHANSLFTDHIALALAAHVAHAYGGPHLSRPIRGGLAPWQERRAKEMILGDPAEERSLSEIAAACGLSASYFARAFRKTIGITPHAWLLRARIERAMALLRRPDGTLESIARACGFADQSQFGRVFSRQTGVIPGVWRRSSIR